VAGSYQTGNNTTGSGLNPDTNTAFQWFLFGAGGCGARHGRDGNSAEWHATANCRNESIEHWEHQHPGRFEEFSLIADSSGPGRTRGGLGYRRRIRLLADTQISATADRHLVGAWGVDGGLRGQPNRFLIGREGQRHRLPEVFGIASPSKFANVPFGASDEYIIESGGGGGFGDPRERAPDLVARDVAFGYVTRPFAESDYGVRLFDDLSVDWSGTHALRGERRPER
jgi:N-methylhydantoinase B